jgi:hypothetical protein
MYIPAWSAVMAVSCFEEERRERASPLCPFLRETGPEMTAPNARLYTDYQRVT